MNNSIRRIWQLVNRNQLSKRLTIGTSEKGVGMEEEQVRRLFGGTQLNSLPGTLGEKRTGLGLIVSRQFVHLSGGDLWVESKIGQGSLFSFDMRGG